MKLRIIQLLSSIMTVVTSFIFYDFYIRSKDAGSTLLTVDGNQITGESTIYPAELYWLLIIYLAVPVIFFIIFLISTYIIKKQKPNSDNQ